MTNSTVKSVPNKSSSSALADLRKLAKQLADRVDEIHEKPGLKRTRNDIARLLSDEAPRLRRDEFDYQTITKQKIGAGEVIVTLIYGPEANIPLGSREKNWIGEICSTLSKRINAITRVRDNVKDAKTSNKPHEESQKKEIHSFLFAPSDSKCIARLSYGNDLSIDIDVSHLELNDFSDYVLSNGDILLDNVQYSLFVEDHFIFARRVDLSETSRLGRPGRSASDLPRPDLPRWAEENRPTQMVRVRLEPSLVQEMDNAAKENNQTRTDIIDAALRSFLKLTP